MKAALPTHARRADGKQSPRSLQYHFPACVQSTRFSTARRWDTNSSDCRRWFLRPNTPLGPKFLQCVIFPISFIFSVTSLLYKGNVRSMHFSTWKIILEAYITFLRSHLPWPLNTHQLCSLEGRRGAKILQEWNKGIHAAGENAYEVCSSAPSSNYHTIHPSRTTMGLCYNVWWPTDWIQESRNICSTSISKWKIMWQ